MGTAMAEEKLLNDSLKDGLVEIGEGKGRIGQG